MKYSKSRQEFKKNLQNIKTLTRSILFRYEINIISRNYFKIIFDFSVQYNY